MLQTGQMLVCLSFCCNVADFPSVDWVVHADCPVDVNTYIHRSGRTARLNKHGASLLMLLPSEEKEMVALLADKKVPIKKIKYVYYLCQLIHFVWVAHTVSDCIRSIMLIISNSSSNWTEKKTKSSSCGAGDNNNNNTQTISNAP